MSDSSGFKINTTAIAHETIDGEVVMVNLNNGSYYSINKAGAVIWGYIDKGIPIKQITELIKDQYSGNSSEIESSIDELFSELQKEELILLNDKPANDTSGNGQFEPKLETEKEIFEKPILQKFTDMQDLLLLDPIHDVDEMGWPKKSTDETDKKEE